MAESKREGLARVRERGNQQAAKVSAARAAAFEVLLLVGEGRGHSDELLHGRHLRGLAAADKNLATALVLGVLRWQIALDARVRPLLSRPDVKQEPAVQIALRMGAFQLLHMDRIPAHAALSESVELVRYAGHPYAAGMVNAVLRKVSAAQRQGVKLHESTAAFAERLGHPLWLVERWVTAFGSAAAQAICEADQKEPACGTLFTAEAEGAGAMPVMDDGSRLVAELAAACAPAAQRVWDCCAAPGGKTIVLARRLAEAEVLATDVSPRRLEALARRLDEAGVTVKTTLADATQMPADAGQFDLILCDVPCSGTGTLARNPDIRHRVSAADLKRQAVRQAEILRAALKRLAPGGRLVYSTCSLEAEENEGLLRDVLLEDVAAGRVARVDAGPVLEGMRDRFVPEANVQALSAQGVLRTLPGNGFEGDGFFAAIFAREM